MASYESVGSVEVTPHANAENSLATMPMMQFEKHLLTPFSESPINKDRRKIAIPIYFGVSMIMLREKHELELSMGRSFIEDEPPPKEMVHSLADKIMLNCTTEDDIKTVLSKRKPVLIFHTILELIRRVPGPLLPLSPKGAQVISKLMLLEPPQPYDFTIIEELYEEIMRLHVENFEETTPRYKRVKNRINDSIQALIQKHYSCTEPNKQKLIKTLNKFNRTIYHDIHTICDKHQRNLARFIIRNVIHLTRRYVESSLRDLRKQRGERWPIARITTRPHIVEYAYQRMADWVGPVLIGQSSTTDFYTDVERRAMINLLASNMDRMWLPNQKPGDVLINNESSYCHPNCVCGRGLNVPGANQARKIR